MRFSVDRLTRGAGAGRARRAAGAARGVRAAGGAAEGERRFRPDRRADRRHASTPSSPTSPRNASRSTTRSTTPTSPTTRRRCSRTMFYSIRHITRFRYSAPVRESVMELRMQPRSEGRPDAAQLPDRDQSARPALCLYRSFRQRGLSLQRAARASGAAHRGPVGGRGEGAWRRFPPPPIRSNGSATTASISPSEHYDLLEAVGIRAALARAQALHVGAQSGNAARRSDDRAQAPEPRRSTTRSTTSRA